MNKKFILISSIFTLFISSDTLAKKKDYYAGYEEIKLSEGDKFGFEQDNRDMPGIKLLRKHIQYFTDSSCNKKLNVKHNNLTFEQQHSTPSKTLFTYEYNGKVMIGVRKSFCE